MDKKNPNLQGLLIIWGCTGATLSLIALALGAYYFAIVTGSVGGVLAFMGGIVAWDIGRRAITVREVAPEIKALDKSKE